MNKQIFVAFLVLAVATVGIHADCEDEDDGAVLGFLKKVGCNIKEGAEMVGTGIADAAKVTKDGAESLGSSAVEGIKDGAKATSDGAQSLGSTVVDGVKDGAQATKDGAEKLGGKIADGAVSAKDTVVDFGSDTKKKVGDLVSK